MNNQTVKPELKSPEIGNILLDEFMGVKFKAYRDNTSYNKEFDTFLECQQWIEESDLVRKGFVPQTRWPVTDRNYHNSWSMLMPVVEKIESLFVAVSIREKICFLDWTGAEPDDKDLLQFLLQFKIIEEECETKILSTFYACVDFAAGYMKLREGGETK